MFFKGNVELEFHENTRMSQFKFKVDGDIEKFMMEVHLHQCEPYPHITCGVKGVCIYIKAFISYMNKLYIIRY